MPEREAVLFANEAFYRAFADRDFRAMMDAWAHDDPVACIHPGWPPLVGHAAVMESWRRILGNPESPKVACRHAQAFVVGDAAWVVCFEQLADQTLVASNMFRRDGSRWRMVHHQAGPCAPLAPGTEEDDDEDEEEAPARPN
jgi:ketosteroid isomerase-like protein